MYAHTCIHVMYTHYAHACIEMYVLSTGLCVFYACMFVCLFVHTYDPVRVYYILMLHIWGFQCADL